MEGAAGPSGMDAQAWKRMCSSYGNASEDLCNSIANLTKKLSKGISSLMACRLIALDKSPGVRPIGIGEILRHLVSKIALSIAQDDIQRAVGCLQLCVGQEAACEAGIIAARRLFDQGNVEAVLLVDATNAFNNLNREAAVQNIRILCPTLAPMLINTHQDPAKLFIDGDYILSQEGTTQGDPLAMTMYALGTLPLIQSLQEEEATQIWYADDASAGGQVAQLCKWWERLTATGPLFGYLPNSSKSWLVVKSQRLQKAKDLFRETGVNITV